MFTQLMLRYVLVAVVSIIIVLMLASRSSSSLHVPSLLSHAGPIGYGARDVFDDVWNGTLGVRLALAGYDL